MLATTHIGEHVREQSKAIQYLQRQIKHAREIAIQGNEFVETVPPGRYPQERR
jgi:hypothetical protein